MGFHTSRCCTVVSRSPLSSRLAWVVLLTGLISGCADEPLVAPGADERAVEFFDQLYNQRNLDGAAALATPDYAEILLGYGTVNAASRYLYNLHYDQVSIEADPQYIDWYQGRQDMVRVRVNLSGTSTSGRADVIQDVVMARQSGQWYLARVIDPPRR